MWDYTVLHWYNDAASNNQMGMPDNFNGGQNAYQILQPIGKPLFISEFGSSGGGSADAQAGTDITQLMQNFVDHEAPSATSPGVFAATIYQLYPNAGENYQLYSTGGSPLPEAQDVAQFLAANP